VHCILSPVFAVLSTDDILVYVAEKFGSLCEVMLVLAAQSA